MRPGAAALVLALAALALGTAVYLFARPAGSTWLTTGRPSTEAVREPGPGQVPQPWRQLGGSLPALLHTLAFSLLGALALGFSRRGLLLSAAFWVAVGMAFEVLQHPRVAAVLLQGPRLADAETPLLLRLLGDYAWLGTFDALDLAAVVVGGAMAFLLGMRWLRAAQPAA